MIRRRNVLTSLTGLFAAVVVVVTSSAPAYAVTPVSGAGTGNGMRLDQVVTSRTINPGQSSTVDIYLTNITSQTTTFQAVINDFVASGDETGNPALILDEGKSAPTHSLKKYVTPISNFTLAPNEKKDVKVSITIPADTPAGGYFGAVRFSAAGADGQGQNVSLSASIASLILVKVPGDYKEQMNIESIDTRKKDKIHSIFNNNKDISTVVRFKNTGDIQEQPFGKITVTNFRGKTVYTAEINSPNPGNVLPDSVRKFSVPLKNIGSFGKYKIQGDFGYGKGQTLTASTTFYVIPMPIMITLLVLLVLIIVAIIQVPRMIKRYNNRVLRRAGRK